MKRSLIGGWLLLVLAGGGCGQAPDASVGSREQPTATSAPIAADVFQEFAPPGQTEEPEEDSVPLQILDWEQTLELAKKHKGQVVVMDLWATYCPPCVAEFPGLVKLHREQGDQVACISVAVEYDGRPESPVESYLAKVRNFLVEQGAEFENVLLSTDPETLFTRKLRHNSLPVVYVFDQQGELAGQFPDPEDPAEFTYQDQVRPLVEKLLAN